MKIQLDTIEKIIRIEESINLGEFYNTIKKLLPDNEWKNFKIETNNTINWANPIVIRDYPYNPTPVYPWWNTPNITCGTSSTSTGIASSSIKTTIDLNSGVYNIEC